MTVKHVDTYSKKWPVAFVGTLSGMYFIFGLPIHIALAAFIYAYAKFYGFQQPDITLSIFIWVSLALIATLILTTISRQKKNIKAFTSYFSEKNFNEATPSNTAKSWTGLSYLALDTKNGTMLYINHPDTTIFNFFVPKDVRVMGFGMHDWKSIEVEGKTLTIYTGKPELPSISISTGKANELYEKINAMRNQDWTYENNVPGYVEHQATHEVICADLSLNNVTDAEAFPGLIRQTHRKVKVASADGAYDTKLCHDELRRKKIKALIPPRTRAGYWPAEYVERNQAVARQRLTGSNAYWKWNTAYNRRSVAETAMYRVKQLFGGYLTLRDYDAQVGEAMAMIRALNKMTRAGMPESVRIA